MTGDDARGIRCPHCGYRADPGEEECALCGSPLEAEGSRGGGREGGDEVAAWDRPGGRFPDDLVRAWKESVFSPSRFFSSLTSGVPLWRATLYVLLFSVVGSGLNLVWNAWMGGMGAAEELYRAVGVSAGQLQLVGFLAAPFLALLLWGLFTLVYHALVMLLLDRRPGIRETARVLGYAWAGPQVFQVVPFVGGMVAGVWLLVLLVVGFREHHGATTARAAAIVLIPALLFTVLPFLLAVAVVLGEVGGGLGGLPGA